MHTPRQFTVTLPDELVRFAQTRADEMGLESTESYLQMLIQRAQARSKTEEPLGADRNLNVDAQYFEALRGSATGYA